jgi:hypothetical protein
MPPIVKKDDLLYFFLFSDAEVLYTSLFLNSGAMDSKSRKNPAQNMRTVSYTESTYM